MSISKLVSWVSGDLSRTIALALAGGFISLSVDSFIAHFVGVAGEHPGQSIPVVTGLVSALALVAGALAKRGSKLRMFAMGAGGLLSAVVGIIGAGFHGLVLLEALSSGPMTLAGLETALFSAPPPLAPLAFAGLGGLAVLIGSPRISLALTPRAALVPVARSSSRPQATTQTMPAVVRASVVLACFLLASGLSAVPGALAKEPSNLKVLAGDKKSIDAGMKELSKGLGVKCEACHVKGAFDKDDVAAKAASRDFLTATVGDADADKRAKALASLLAALKIDAPKRAESVWAAVGRFKKR